MGIGPIVAGIGLLLERRIGAHATYVSEVLPGLLVFSLGLSMTVAPLTSTVMASVSAGRSGLASGVNNAISRVAGLIAIAALGAVVSASFQSRLARQLSGHALTPAARAAIAQARSRPLVVTDPSAPVAERATIHTALVHASVGAFGLGMEIAAALAVLGGVVSLIGLGRSRTASETAAPETAHPSS